MYRKEGHGSSSSCSFTTLCFKEQFLLFMAFRVERPRMKDYMPVVNSEGDCLKYSEKGTCSIPKLFSRLSLDLPYLCFWNFKTDFMSVFFTLPFLKLDFQLIILVHWKHTIAVFIKCIDPVAFIATQDWFRTGKAAVFTGKHDVFPLLLLKMLEKNLAFSCLSLSLSL